MGMLLLVVVVDEIAFQRREEFSTQCFVNSLQKCSHISRRSKLLREAHHTPTPLSFLGERKKKERVAEERERELSPFMSSLRKMIVV